MSIARERLRNGRNIFGLCLMSLGVAQWVGFFVGNDVSSEIKPVVSAVPTNVDHGAIHDKKNAYKIAVSNDFFPADINSWLDEKREQEASYIDDQFYHAIRFENQDRRESKRLLLEMLDMWPAHKPAMKKLLQFALEDGKFASTLNQIAKRVKKAEYPGVAQAFLAESLLEIGRASDAIPFFVKTLKSAGSNRAELLGNLAKTYEEVGQTREAIRAYREASANHLMRSPKTKEIELASQHTYTAYLTSKQIELLIAIDDIRGAHTVKSEAALRRRLNN